MRAESTERKARTDGPQWLIWLAPVLAALAALAGWLWVLWFWHRGRVTRRAPRPPGPVADTERVRVPGELPREMAWIRGLSQEEAEARRTTELRKSRRRAWRRARLSIWRNNILNIFILDLVGLMALQLLLDDPLGALGSFVVLFFNITINIFQEWLGLKRVEKLSAETRPSVTAIRDGETASIDQEDIVIGDVLVVGPGDRFEAGGRILAASSLSVAGSDLDEGEPSGSPRPVSPRHVGLRGSGLQEEGSQTVGWKAGDVVPQHRYCLGGWAAYQVEEFPQAEDITASIGVVGVARDERTLLQRIIYSILRTMAIVVIVMLVILLVDLAGWGGRAPGEILALYRTHIGIVFSFAPGSLFLMIAVSYAAGAFDLGFAGALVRDVRAVESLAQMTALCFSRASIWARTAVGIEPLPRPDGQPGLPEDHVRRLLGAYAHSTRVDHPYVRALGRAVSGERRVVVQESPYLTALGWSGLTFVDPGIEGTYVLGKPEVLQAHLERPERDVGEDAEQPGPGLLRRTLGRVGGLFRRSEQGMPGGEAPEDGRQGDAGGDAGGLAEATQEAAPEDAVQPETGPERPGLWSRIRAGAGRVLDRIRGPEPQVALDPQIRLLLAYSPQPRSLFDANARPELPSDLIPICALRFGEQIQQDAVESIHALQEAGVQVKLFVPGDPESALAAAARLYPDRVVDRPLEVPSGAELSGMDEEHLTRSASEATVFALDAPGQEADLVRALRRGGGHVAVLGDAVDDVPVMRQADLRMSFKSSSQVILAASGLVLMRDALQALPRVVQRGRRNVNSVLDVLVLNLAQIVHLLVLELLVLTVRQGVLFYHPVHGGVIAAFTIVLPGLTLSFWSAKRAVPGSSIVPRLARFVLPAGLTRVAAVMVLDYVLVRAGMDIVHRRNAVTLLLILTGLALYVHLQPALFIKGAGRFKWRYVGAAVVLLGLYYVLVSIPLAQEFLYLRFLPREDYVTVGLVAVLWTLGVHALWRIRRLNPYLG